MAKPKCSGRRLLRMLGLERILVVQSQLLLLVLMIQVLQTVKVWQLQQSLPKMRCQARRLLKAKAERVSEKIIQYISMFIEYLC